MTQAPSVLRVGSKSLAPVKAVPAPTPKEVDECLNPLHSMPFLLNYPHYPHPCIPQDNRDFSRHLSHFMGQLSEDRDYRGQRDVNLALSDPIHHCRPDRLYLELAMIGQII